MPQVSHAKLTTGDKNITMCVGLGRLAGYKPCRTFLTWGNVAGFGSLLGRCRKTYALRGKNFARGAFLVVFPLAYRRISLSIGIFLPR